MPTHYNLTARHITLAGNDGEEIEAYYAAPEGVGTCLRRPIDTRR